MATFYGLPILFASEINLEVSSIIYFFLIYYLLLLFGTYKLVKYIKSVKGESIKKVTINKEGVHYLKLNGKRESILFSELNKSPSPFSDDVFIKTVGVTPYSSTRLMIFYQGNEKHITFSNTDVMYTGAIGNWRELRGHFIQGITLFCPHLTISESVYSDFFIHPETFEFDTKEFKKTFLIVAIFILIILLGIDLYTKYRFGYSLIFD
ncbi:hypothetical protein [Galbibacter pacificus]|uniref:Uncharacterized protein n=1 Tax=Galbibacter pacificus TaxID=2996052 RepID=A0ABT6FVA4_9FLAO|nr:hypothetical protein [Galbibacter pacificus]MDG3583896.1 hypothetical protein [Galbibacter pacificus]MDG3587186.1 hypothetical protein [Galbibacter pacificus]